MCRNCDYNDGDHYEPGADYRKSISVQSYYMNSVSDLNSLVERIAAIVEDNELEFDTVVGTGMSGMLVLPLLSLKFDCNYLAIRKTDDGSHSDAPAEGKLGKRWLFVDDFIDSGKTIARVMRVVKLIADDMDFETEFVGALSYESLSNYVQSPGYIAERYLPKFTNDPSNYTDVVQRPWDPYTGTWMTDERMEEKASETLNTRDRYDY